MRFEEEIKQDRFHSEHQKLHLNLVFTGNFLLGKQVVFFKNYKLTPQQYNVLRILRGQRGKSIPVRMVMERMLDKNSNVTRIVDKLEAKGLVLRLADEVDKRQVLLQITEEGLQLLAKIDPELKKMEAAMAAITPDQAATMNAWLDRMREGL